MLLVVQDNVDIASMLLDTARGEGLKCVVTARGAEAAALARQYRPEAISLGSSLPDIHGWAVLSRLKHDPELRHIPVQVVVEDMEQLTARARGAFSSLSEPVAAPDLCHDLVRMLEYARERKRRLLVIDGSFAAASRIGELVGGANVNTTVAASSSEAMNLLRQRKFECVAIDTHPGNAAALEFIRQASSEPALRNLPFVLFAERAWQKDNRQQLEVLGRTMILRVAPSLESLLDECAMFLHSPVADLPEAAQQILRAPSIDVLAGKTVLIVDDDLRNIFALSSLLERHEMRVVSTNTGGDAVRLIDETEDLSLVLLDIMMPKMDGYETMRQMRAKKFGQPIIALTAKAMTGDREKCLEAGASDYIAKPVDSENFLSLLRVWLNR